MQASLPDDVTVTSDEWRTLHRALPRDLYEVIKSLEDDIADAAGVGRVSMGGSVAVWTIWTRFNADRLEELKSFAKEWNDHE